MAAYPIVGSLFLLLTAAECSKILIIVGHPARSHYNVVLPIIEELARRNHDLTVQAFYSLNKPLSNVKELIIQQGKTSDIAALKEYFINSIKYGPIPEIRTFGATRAENCALYLNDDTSKALVTSKLYYDLVIVDAFLHDCPTAVAVLAGKHIINLYTSISYPWQVTHAPTPMSYIPHHSAMMSGKMNFFQRLENTFNIVGSRFIYQYHIQAKNQKVISAILPQASTIEEMEKKIVFSLTNGDPVIDPPRPSMPNIVHCGGMHCRKANPLPKELYDFVESSGDDGFIIFGLGSNVKAEYLSSEIVQHVVAAFSRLKQKIVWKFEGKLENVSNNIKTVDWMPQQDLIGHPKARLFITHAGLLSLQEAIYHGVPVITIPFFGDQRCNSIRIQELGVGERVDFLNITPEGFYEIITKVLGDKNYKENAMKYSAIFKDQPERPIDRAVFWIEYVIRHDGARHFRSAGEELNFFQYFLLDVVGFMLITAISAVSLLIYFFRLACRKIGCSKESEREYEKKRK